MGELKELIAQKNKELKDATASAAVESKHLSDMIAKNELKIQNLEITIEDVKGQLEKSRNAHTLTKDEVIVLQKTMSEKDSELSTLKKSMLALEISKAKLDESVKSLGAEKIRLEQELKHAVAAKMVA